mmetsp:Transcript_24916/g.78526  ORF Transcript_24916/g.78526 Transcript_24916/m.78526 type:complete len:150 (-) Transcript_24916:704-1153(-)
MCLLWITFTARNPWFPFDFALKKQLMPVRPSGELKPFIMPTWIRSLQFTAYFSLMLSFGTTYGTTRRDDTGLRGGDQGNRRIEAWRETDNLLEGDCDSPLPGEDGSRLVGDTSEPPWELPGLRKAPRGSCTGDAFCSACECCMLLRSRS